MRRVGRLDGEAGETGIRHAVEQHDARGVRLSGQAGDVGSGTNHRHPGFHHDVLSVMTGSNLDLVSTGRQVYPFLNRGKGEFHGSIGSCRVGGCIDVDGREQRPVLQPLHSTVTTSSHRSLVTHPG